MASTYVNDLRLEEIADGEQSGTWGSTTNTNLELIGDALGFGTEAITTNADTFTSTVADGAVDAARAMYLKYTGTLDSACTITIAPNTLSRLQFIENGTSGSQNIIISQGSGANITIPPGDTKAVYLDGAGSGAAVVDAFASLSVVDLKVQDDLTVTDDATIGGTLGVTGVVTANAGVVVDNITIDGTEIDLSSGDLTLDVAGDIILDADGADIIFKDGGTDFGRIKQSSSDLIIRAGVQDKDIKLQGDDGGVAITALQLDMSLAGKADFNAGATFADNVILGTGANLFLNDNGKLNLGNSSDLQIYFDATNSHIDATAGNLDLDVAGNIHLDADGGDISFRDGGTESLRYSTSADGPQFFSSVSNKDIIFKGNDGGSTITALTLDMSAAGMAVFTGGVNLSSSAISFSGSISTPQVAASIFRPADNTLAFSTANNERMRVTSAGDLLIGKTTTAIGTAGHRLTPTAVSFVRDGGGALLVNRLSDDGNLAEFYGQGTHAGTIGVLSSKLHIASVGNSGIRFRDDLNCFTPCNADGTNSDNDQNVGQASVRYGTIFATSSSINTSDKTEKQDIEEITDAEKRVAVVAKGLMRKYRWIDAVAKKGDKARIHFGIMAQDLQDAFTAEGLDASRYGMFCSDTWWEKEISVAAVEANEEKEIEAKDAYTYIDTKQEATEGYTERTRLGVRYSELLAFIITAI